MEHPLRGHQPWSRPHGATAWGRGAAAGRNKQLSCLLRGSAGYVGALAAQMEMGCQGPWGGSTKVHHTWRFVRFLDPTSHFADDKPRPERPGSLTVPELSWAKWLGWGDPALWACSSPGVERRQLGRSRRVGTWAGPGFLWAWPSGEAAGCLPSGLQSAKDACTRSA